MPQWALPLSLLLGLYGFEDVLEHLETCDRWMRNYIIFCPLVEVMRKSVNGWVMRRVSPVVRNNRIAAPPAGEAAGGFADRLHGVQATAPLDNKAPSSDNSSA